MARIGYLLRDIAQQCPKRWRSAAAEIRTLSDIILIEIGDGTPAQSQRIVLDVFRRSDQSPFFRVPRREHYRALRPLPRLHLLRDCARRFQHAYGAAHVVRRAWSPCIAVPADHHDLIGNSLPRTIPNVSQISL